MKKNLVLAGIVILALIAGVTTYSQKSTRTENAGTKVNPDLDTSQPENNVTETGSAGENTYTLTQIALHNNKEDCWLAVEDKVFDVTDYIAGAKHPGGNAIIEGCGKDATVLFNTRPMGSGTPHSEKARNFLPNFQIGTLVK